MLRLGITADADVNSMTLGARRRGMLGIRSRDPKPEDQHSAEEFRTTLRRLYEDVKLQKKIPLHSNGNLYTEVVKVVSIWSKAFVFTQKDSLI